MAQNKSQHKFWSGSGGEMWVKDQSVFERRLQPLGNLALRKINLMEGMDVIDIGCGSGSTTIEISALVGDKGSATGVDISEPLLQLANKRVAASGLTCVRFLNEDVQTKCLIKNHYDAAFSRFGVMFFDDPTKAFGNIHQSLRKRGQLAFVCFQSPEQNVWASIGQKIFKKNLDVNMYEDKRAPSPFAFQEQSYILSILETAGFVGITIEGVETTVDWYSGISIDQAVNNLINANPVVAEKLSSIDVSTQCLIRAELETSYAEYRSGGAIKFPVAVWVVSAVSSY